MLLLPSCQSYPRRLFLRRCYLTAVTFTSSGPTSASSLVDHLEHTSTQETSKPDVTLFALSQDVPELPGVLQAIQRLYPTAIGCLCSSPSADRHTLALAHFHSDARESYIAFRSTEQGRAKTSVGHWRPPGEQSIGDPAGSSVDESRLQRAFEGGDWSGLWGDADPATTQAGAMSALRGLEDADPQQVSAMVAFSTPLSASRFLQQVISRHSIATGAGLLAPSTPFSTGHPHTLFWRGEIVDFGAVGVARVAHTDQPDWEIESGWAGLEPVKAGEALLVDACQGNLLLSLQPVAGVNANPTRHLLSLLSSAHLPPLGKDKEFFLGFFSGPEGTSPERVVRILSGDPGRGGMALDCEESLETGDRVAFLHRPDSPARAHDRSVRRVPALEFYSPSGSDDAQVDGAQNGVFRAASDEGVLVRGRAERVAGGWVSVQPLSR